MGNIQGEPGEEDSNKTGSNNTGRDSTKDKYNKGHIVIPYTQGLGDSIKKIYRKCGIQTHFKGNRDHQEYTGQVKRQGSFRKKEWGHLLLSVGETSRTFGERYKEHLKES